MIGLRQYYRATLCVALFMPLAVSACAKTPVAQARAAATVSVAPVKRASVPYLIEANGVVMPMQTAAVVPQVDGIILAVDFQEGDEVRAGQPLFRIDARPYENAYEQSLAVLGRDSANDAHNKTEVARYQKLLDSKVVTPQEAGVQFTAAATSEATVRADKAAVANAKFALDNTVIRAPITGKTGFLLVKRGNLVRAGAAAPLVVINQVRPILVRFAVPSSQLSMILQYGARGGLPVAAVPGGIAAASPSIDSLAAAATANPIQDRPSQQGTPTGGLSGGGTDGTGSSGDARGGGGRTKGAGGLSSGPSFVGDRVMGKLSAIDNAVDTTTATVQLKATFDNMSGRLWAGQFVPTSLHLFDEDNALVIPSQAVVTGQRGAYVYVVDRADTARQHAVVVERYAGGLAIISSGVHEGDRVVIDGQARLTPDVPVRLRGADTGGGGRRGGGGGGRGKGGRGKGNPGA
jgi:multidrug efflux system membrane fusion protein